MIMLTLTDIGRNMKSTKKSSEYFPYFFSAYADSMSRVVCE